MVIHAAELFPGGVVHASVLTRLKSNWGKTQEQTTQKNLASAAGLMG